MSNYISITHDGTARTSNFMIGDDTLKVVGVLDHGSEIAPSNLDNAIRLRDWLNRWIEIHTPEVGNEAADLRNEAAIHAAGTEYTTDELVLEYREYASLCRQYGRSVTMSPGVFFRDVMGIDNF